jgi:hypothetical protein
MRTILFFLAILLPFHSWASSKPSAKPGMHALAKEISALQKFLFSESQFAAPENQPQIRTSIDAMSKHLSELETSFKGDPVLEANLKLFSRHVKDANRSFQEGNKPFSRYMLQSSLQMCISCHTRGKVDWDFALPEDTVAGATELERADFFFATRQFEKGGRHWSRWWRDTPVTRPAATACVRRCSLWRSTTHG